jgi:hypothetical protein
MSTRKTPNTAEWRQLYEAAVDFKKIKCWEWMYDDDIFGVKDPESGEVGYCCIMGNAGEHFGIAAYLGSEGLSGILGLLSGAIDPEDPDNLFTQKCLICSFEDRKALAPEDLEIIKGLGLKFRGRNEWPVFRHYEPGLFPWFLNAPQCRFLTHVISQALDVSLRCRGGKAILDHDIPFTFLVRVATHGKNGELIWKDEYLTAEPPKQEFVSFHIIDEMRAKRLRSIKPQRKSILEIDTFFAPSPIKENGRPYYPKVCLLLDHSSGMVISFEMFKDIKEEGFKCIEMLANYVEHSGMMPSKLLVSRNETYYLFSDVCRQLGIELEMVERLDFMEEARHDMFSFFQNL